MAPNLYEQIGAQKIREVIQAFYDRAFEDAMIGYFFVNTDKADLVEKQTLFAIALLGGPKNYHGHPLKTAHVHLKIRPAHFGRRQVIMAEVLKESSLASDLSEQWLAAEEKLKPLIVHGHVCNG